MPEKLSKAIAPALPAATILLVRDGAQGPEVFMVKRHHQIEFVSGALVFPGGKVEPGDSDPVLPSLSDGGEDWPVERRALAVAAIREAFEESGILLARDVSGRFISEERLAALDIYRKQLDTREIGMAEMLRKEGLRLALDQLVPFAHWITPEHMAKRFDTHFFLAPSPVGHAGRHDGRELVESVWVTPRDALADSTRWKIVFPTRLNLMKLGEAPTVSEALARARAHPPVTVTPWIEQTPEGPMLRIVENAGYAQTSIPLKDGT